MHGMLTRDQIKAGLMNPIGTVFSRTAKVQLQRNNLDMRIKHWKGFRHECP